MVHISEILRDHERHLNVCDKISVGDIIKVKVIEIDSRGQRFSIKVL